MHSGSQWQSCVPKFGVLNSVSSHRFTQDMSEDMVVVVVTGSKVEVVSLFSGTGDEVDDSPSVLRHIYSVNW